MRVSLLYNEPLPSHYDELGEGVAVASVMDSVNAIKAVLEGKGCHVSLLGLRPPLKEVVRKLQNVKADVVFNLFEGFDGQPETEAAIAKSLEEFGQVITGARSEVLRLCLDKAETKRRLLDSGVPTAPFQVMNVENLDTFQMEFPVIVKPIREDASHGIGASSVVRDIESLEIQVTQVQERYGAPALVETFIEGREFNASVIGGACPRALPPSEIVYSEQMPEPRILTYSAKWSENDISYKASVPVCPAQVSDEFLARIQNTALAAHSTVGSPAYARIDMRADLEGNIFVLEVNPNPDLSPCAGMALQAKTAGMPYEDFVEKVLNLALAEADLSLTPMQPEHVEELVGITQATGFFRPDEVEVAREVLTEAALNGEASDYIVRVAFERARPVGYICIGTTPATLGTWDIYWVAVRPESQGKGIGSKLMNWAESYISKNMGRLAVVETSSQPLYEPTRRFYAKLGYQQKCRVPDFYDVGDDKLVLTKSLDGGAFIRMEV